MDFGQIRSWIWDNLEFGTTLVFGHFWIWDNLGFGTTLVFGHFWTWDNLEFGTTLVFGHFWTWDNSGLGRWPTSNLGRWKCSYKPAFKITFRKMFNRQLCCILCLGWLYRICLWRVSGFSYEKKRMASSVKSRLVFILQQLSCEKIEEGKRKGTRSSRIFLQQTIKLAGMKIDQLCLFLFRRVKLLM